MDSIPAAAAPAVAAAVAGAAAGAKADVAAAAAAAAESAGLAIHQASSAESRQLRRRPTTARDPAAEAASRWGRQCGRRRPGPAAATATTLHQLHHNPALFSAALQPPAPPAPPAPLAPALAPGTGLQPQVRLAMPARNSRRRAAAESATRFLRGATGASSSRCPQSWAEWYRSRKCTGMPTSRRARPLVEATAHGDPPSCSAAGCLRSGARTGIRCARSDAEAPEAAQ
mmetsp:Transcript_56726/g.146189  ORF Transcript_56726/g.146189 Transcript_56726/m.146189 type:complete len:229 (-) Transcript_56726:96-782(-)